MKLKICQESIDILLEYSTKLPTIYNDIINDTNVLKKSFYTNKEDFGPHAEFFSDLVSYIIKSEESSKDLLDYVSKCLNEKAIEYEDILKRIEIGSSPMAMTDINITKMSSIDWSTSMLTPEEQKIVEEEGGFIEYSSTIPDEIKYHIPKTSGTIIDNDEGFAFIPSSIDAKKEMMAYGVEFIQYVNDVPDFTPFTNITTSWGQINSEVEVGHMTTSRKNPTFEYGTRPRGTSHDIHYDLGNFAQADNALAAKINDTYHINITGEDIESFRLNSGYTWHECADGKTMQLISTVIHGACPHTGGVAFTKFSQAYGNYEVDD